MKTCPDCNGKGTYQGFNTAVEPCGNCNGVGKLGASKEDALQSVFDYNITPRIVVGTPIYIYDAGWHESFVIEVFSKFYKTKTPCDTFRIPKARLTYNMTQDRWEHIRHGTPVWH